MKNIIFSVMASIALISFPVFAGQPAEDANMPDGTSGDINENHEDVERPHLDLLIDGIDSGSGALDPGGDGLDNKNPDPELDRDWVELDGLGDNEYNESQDGLEGDPGDSGEYEDGGLYLQQEVNFRWGIVSGEFHGAETQTRFRNEITSPSAISDDGILKLYEGYRVKIASELMVDQGDVGEFAQCMVVALYKPTVGEGELSSFMLSEEGWKDWNSDFATLAGVACELEESYKIIAHDDQLFPGEFYFWFGYELENGKIVHNPESLSFKVQ